RSLVHSRYLCKAKMLFSKINMFVDLIGDYHYLGKIAQNICERFQLTLRVHTARGIAWRAKKQYFTFCIQYASQLFWSNFVIAFHTRQNFDWLALGFLCHSF